MTPDDRADEGIDNGNTFVFCDYVQTRHVTDKPQGCIRGAGHNGPHVIRQIDDMVRAPVLLTLPDEWRGVRDGRREELGTGIRCFTCNGLLAHTADCPAGPDGRRAPDWQTIETPVMTAELRRQDTPENREFWAYVAQTVADWERTKPDWARRLEVVAAPPERR